MDRLPPAVAIERVDPESDDDGDEVLLLLLGVVVELSPVLPDVELLATVPFGDDESFKSLDSRL